MIHGAVRWNTSSRSTSGWIFGTNWIADGPVPITATRRPARSCSWSQSIEWNRRPANDSRPGSSGVIGLPKGPVAETSTSAAIRPAEVSNSQRRLPSSQRASLTSVSYEMWRSTSRSAATERR